MMGKSCAKYNYKHWIGKANQCHGSNAAYKKQKCFTIENIASNVIKKLNVFYIPDQKFIENKVSALAPLEIMALMTFILQMNMLLLAAD